LTTVITVLVGCVGALIAWLIHFPAPFLTGPAVAVATGGLLGFSFRIPNILRETIFLFLGITLGASVTPEILNAAKTWPVSLIFNCISTALVMIFGWFLLGRYFNLERKTAILASSPGHLSFVLSLGSTVGAEVSNIAIIQSIRVFILTLAVPVILSLLAKPDELLSEIVSINITLSNFFLLSGVSALSGVLARHFRVPAALLLSGMLFSSIGHGINLTPGSIPQPLSMFCFIILGSLIGSRFTGVTYIELRRCCASGLAVTFIGLVVSLILAYLVHRLTGVDIFVVLVAFAPGGFETMVVMSSLVGADPAYVAIHHITRLFFLSVFVPIVLIEKQKL
jgi:membrane AbrB-like protein